MPRVRRGAGRARAAADGAVCCLRGAVRAAVAGRERRRRAQRHRNVRTRAAERRAHAASAPLRAQAAPQRRCGCGAPLRSRYQNRCATCRDTARVEHRAAHGLGGCAKCARPLAPAEHHYCSVRMPAVAEARQRAALAVREV